MTKLRFQSIVQYELDTESGSISILKKFTVPINGAKGYNAKPVPKVQHDLETEETEVEYL